MGGRIVYACLQPKFNYLGTTYERGDLIPGLENEARVSSTVANGRVFPVLFETLSEEAQQAYDDALSAKAEPEPVPEEQPVSEPSVSREDLEAEKVDDLRDYATELGIPHSGLRKEDLIDAILAKLNS